MICRREFLLLLASLIAVFRKASASQPANRKPDNGQNSHRLILHRGWVLRSDDPGGI